MFWRIKVQLDDTKVKLKDTINDLKNIKAQIEILWTYQDWIRRFLNKLIIKLGGA
jgi:hypothetical protein